jgi:hypothetical protein
MAIVQLMGVENWSELIVGSGAADELVLVTGEGSLSPSYQVHKEQGTRCLSGSREIKAGATRHGSVPDAEGAHHRQGA